MIDDRIGLSNGSILNISEVQKIIILEEIGRGGSCIVYNGKYTDNIGTEHFIRIKECYPFDINITRDCSNNLIVDDLYKEKFYVAKENFKNSYIRNVELKNTLDITNSTTNPTEIYEFNNTLYVLISFDEGTDYSRYNDKNLKELFEHIKSLCKIIALYHDKGLLHLDIKPENIMILKETAEHILLFDFDSIISISDLSNRKSINISFSEGFSAPEQAYGKVKNINTHTDIYSIGALLFYKLFGRKAESKHSDMGVVYNYKECKYYDERLQPKLYRKIDELLSHTLRKSILARFKNINQLIELIDEIIKLADVESNCILSNFSYNTNCFIGRKKELIEINNILTDNQIVFLSGIGGIGKTELAKKYINSYEKIYNRIIFIYFNNSIKECFCSDDVKIYNFQKDEKENTDEYFNRKLSLLKNELSNDDIIVIDNFDVEYDEDLEKIFELNCKFIITTREDFSDFNYAQINIDKMSDYNDIRNLFIAYNKNEYSKKDWDNIDKIIELLDRHTMTVELLAKYLRITDENPKQLFIEMSEKEGITNTDETGVKHRKDKRLNYKSINNHLLFLFDLSKFSNEENIMISSLSLLGYIKISAEQFLKYFNIENKEYILNNLIKFGWIQFDENTNKISLHQIILDLIYNKFNPTTENCADISKAMIEYINEDMPNYIEKKTRKKLLQYFMDRISGVDLLYADLCLNYCEHISINIKYIDLAEEIYKKYNRFCMLDKIYYIRTIHILSEDIYYNIENYDDIDFCYIEKINTALDYMKKAYSYAEKYCNNNNYMAEFCLKLVFKSDEIIGNDIVLCMANENEYALVDIYDFISHILNKGIIALEKSTIDNKSKIKLYEKIKSFYDECDFSNMYRSNRFSDKYKMLYYQKIIKSIIAEENKDTIYVETISYEDLGNDAMERKDYEKALELYYKSLEEEEYTNTFVALKISDIYIIQNNINSAINILKKILDYDKKDKPNFYSDFICTKLIDILISNNMYEDAVKYCNELIKYNINSVDKNYYTYSYIIFAYHKLYYISGYKNEEYWNKAVEYFYKIYNEEWNENIYDFVLDFSNKKSNSKKFEFLFYAVEKTDSLCRDINIKYLDYIIKETENNNEYIMYYLKCLLKYSEIYTDWIFEDAEKAYEYSKKAEEVIKSNNIKDEYLENLVYLRKAKSYQLKENYDYDIYIDILKKCNFYKIAEVEADTNNIEKSIKCWDNAYSNYNYIDNYSMTNKCLDIKLKILKSVLYKRDFAEHNDYINTCNDKILILEQLGLKDDILKLLYDMYNMSVEYYCNKCSENDINNSFSYIVENIGNKLYENKYYKYGFYMYIISIIIKYSDNLYENFLLKDFSNNSEDIFKKFQRVIHRHINPDDVDDIIYKYNNISEYKDFKNIFFEYYKEFEWFSEKYEKMNIEFKR